MSEITVIGLGAMGAALAGALIREGHRITVWNRTQSKAEPLLRQGAGLAQDPAAAVRASPVVVVCVRDYGVTREILGTPEVLQHLSGRVIAQLSGGTPQEARESERWIHERGAAYLDGEIMVYPDRIGTSEGRILIAGPERVFHQCEPLLRALAGRLEYVGEPVGAANAYGTAMGAVLYGALLGALHGARICQVEGLAIDQFAKGMKEADLSTIDAGVLDLLDRIGAERYGETQGSLGTGADGAEKLLEHARATGIDVDFAAYVASAFRRGTEAGLSEQDAAALIKVLR